MFKQFLDLNKISYAKAERLKSKKDGRALPIFRPYQSRGSRFTKFSLPSIVYEAEELRSPVSVTQCYNCQSFGHLAKNCRSKQKCLICGENHSHKGCQNRETRKSKCANCKEPHVASYKGCPEYKKTGIQATCG